MALKIVAEYVTAVLLFAARALRRPLPLLTLGVVGCGDIGTRVALRARALGMCVLKNDPPLEAAAPRSHALVPLGRLLREADLVTVHVPLTRTGPHATAHLFRCETLAQMQPHAWLINTSRGGVADGQALKTALRAGALGGAALDVWENEPTPDRDLLRSVTLGTPHIAGHSYDGKLLGTVLMYQAVVRHFALPSLWNYDALARPPARLVLAPPAGHGDETMWLDAAVRAMYDVRKDHTRMQELLTVPRAHVGPRFRALRTRYPRRRAFRLHTMPQAAVPASLRRAVTCALRVRLYSDATASQPP